MKTLNWIALILVIIGALNWGMIGFFNIDVVHMIFGGMWSRIIYAVVGIAGIWSFIIFRDIVKSPKGGSSCHK